MKNNEKIKVTTDLLTFFLKCHNDIKISKSERDSQILILTKWKNDEPNRAILKEVKTYLKMLKKVELNKGKLDYEIRKLKYLNEYFIREKNEFG